MSNAYLWTIVGISALITYSLRILPFVIFRAKPLSSRLSLGFECGSLVLLGVLTGQGLFSQEHVDYKKILFFAGAVLGSQMIRKPNVVFYGTFLLYFLTEKYFSL